MKKLLRTPFLRLARLMGIPQLQNRLDRQAKNVTDLQEAVESLSALIHENVRSIYLHVDKQIFPDAINHVETRREELLREIATVKKSIDRIRVSSPSESVIASTTSTRHSQSPVIDQSMYVSLEDAFRGDKNLVRKRQMAYLPYIEGVVNTDHQLVDLGCGRGEWLLLLQERKLPAYGVDSNEAALSDCSELGLVTKQGDLIEHLKSLPDSSVGAITMFQVLEHLPFNAIVEVLRESRRVLRDGGVFIGEVPNGETLRVGASTFWIDPTHERPLFPGVLRFLAPEVGFSKVDGVYSSPLAPEPNLEGLPDGAAQAIQQLHHLVNGPGDFAVIAMA